MIYEGDKVIVIPNTCCHKGRSVMAGKKGPVIPNKSIVVPGTIKVGEEVSVWTLNGQKVVIIDEVLDKYYNLYGCNTYPTIPVDWPEYRGDARAGKCWNSGHPCTDKLVTVCGSPLRMYSADISFDGGGASFEIAPGSSGTVIPILSGSFGSTFEARGVFMVGYPQRKFHTYEINQQGQGWVFDTGIEANDYDVWVAGTAVSSGPIVWGALNWGSWFDYSTLVIATNATEVVLTYSHPYEQTDSLMNCPAVDHAVVKFSQIGWYHEHRAALKLIKIDGSVIILGEWNSYLWFPWVLCCESNSYLYVMAGEGGHFGSHTHYHIYRKDFDGNTLWHVIQDGFTDYIHGIGAIGSPAIRGSAFAYRFKDLIVERSVSDGAFLRSLTVPPEITLRGEVSFSNIWWDYFYIPANGSKLLAIRWYDFKLTHVFHLPFTIDEVILDYREGFNWIEVIVRRTNGQNYLMRLYWENAEVIEP